MFPLLHLYCLPPPLTFSSLKCLTLSVFLFMFIFISCPDKFIIKLIHYLFYPVIILISAIAMNTLALRIMTMTFKLIYWHSPPTYIFITKMPQLKLSYACWSSFLWHNTATHHVCKKFPHSQHSPNHCQLTQLKGEFLLKNITIWLNMVVPILLYRNFGLLNTIVWNGD